MVVYFGVVSGWPRAHGLLRLRPPQGREAAEVVALPPKDDGDGSARIDVLESYSLLVRAARGRGDGERGPPALGLPLDDAEVAVDARKVARAWPVAVGQDGFEVLEWKGRCEPCG